MDAKIKKKRRLGLVQRRNLKGIPFVLPWMVGFAVFFVYPLVQSAYFSLLNIRIVADGTRKSTFVAFENYIDIFRRDIYFTERLRGFFLNTLISLPVIMVFALMIAMLINQRIKGKSVFRTLFFLPVIVVSGPVMQMLTAETATTIPMIERYGLYGMLDMLPYWMQEPLSFLFGQLILILWYSGVPILIFLAGLQKIDRVLYEAALIDGASAWVAFWKITLPSLKSMLLINVIYTLVFLATSETNEIITLIKSNMFSPDRGYGIASAMAWSYTVCIVAALGFCFLIIGRERKQKEKRAIIRLERGVTGNVKR